MKIKPVILCGGAGTRLWPKSKKNLPKQFIDWGGWTLFEKTLERVKAPIYDCPIITTNSAYLKLVKKFLKKYKFKKYQIILEPFKKNTAPAVLSSALLSVVPLRQPMILFPADNLIGKVSQFNKSINFHKKYLGDNNIFIFGIKPKSASTQYGYFITKKFNKNLNNIKKFIEKPNKKKAKIIVKNNAYMNAGIFYARKDSLINNFKIYQRKMFNLCKDSVDKSKVDKNIYYLNKSSFKKIKEISFDYAILERAKDVNGIKLNISLVDLGNWVEIWKFFKKNISRNNLKKNTIKKPWGNYINLFFGKGFLLKEININPKSSISLQKHFHRSEKWTIIFGKPKITINNLTIFKKENDSIFIPKGSVHRIENFYNKPVKIVEVQIGSLLKESDIIRYKDVYGRTL